VSEVFGLNAAETGRPAFYSSAQKFQPHSIIKDAENASLSETIFTAVSLAPFVALPWAAS
jgi:hypothetical protein